MIKTKKDTCKRNCSSMQVGANWSNVHMFHPNPAWVRLDERSTVPNVTARNAWEQHWSTHFGPWKWRTPSRPTNPSLTDLFTSLSLMSSNMYAVSTSQTRVCKSKFMYESSTLIGPANIWRNECLSQLPSKQSDKFWLKLMTKVWCFGVMFLDVFGAVSSLSQIINYTLGPAKVPMSTKYLHLEL